MKFSTTLLALAIASSAAIAPSAFAQSADLSINGRIFPGACVVDLDGGGVADLGNIRLDSLQTDSATKLDQIDMNMTVACESAVRFAFSGVDNAGDSSTNANEYGLGVTAADEKIGSARLGMADVIIDGASSHAMISGDNGETWQIILIPTGIHVPKGSLIGFNTERVGTGPSAIKDMQATLQVQPTIAPTSGLTVTEDVAINGNATINLTYL
ncbi:MULTISPECIES: DUF1120 domain-containing protein [Stenotrophomonas]|uniref:DUF1120 domain-containing protein n=1 Tax=Stenotrophomonas TaxID=40323 RepID=UPI000871CF53|nr:MULTISPECIES: DUF1120 domain-containing protein [Stenotrophomonas]OEZ00665.1 hypothetical protein BIY45_10335 [Stenotrophomonas sp. BIIR7]